MFKTKSQVDRHVSNVLNQLRDPKERNVKGLAFASLYYKINEYDVALRYLQGFLTVKETYASAHKLLGQIYEAKKQPAKALDAYKRSLELDENQRDVLRKVCEMCVQVDVPPDISQYWVERANRSIRGDPIVLALKEKICSGGHDKSEGDEDDLEELLAQQLVKQPRDTSLRCRLVRHLLERGRVGEARKHVLEVEQTGVLVENLEWGRVVRQVLEECIERAGPGANTAALDQQRLLTCLCRLSSLSLRHGSMGESVRTIHEFDSAIERCQELRQVSESWNTLHMEMQAQLFYFIGTLLLKKAVSGDLRWDEARNLAGACYGVSVGVEPFTRRAAWYSRDGDERQKTYDTWRNLAIRRYVITGHMMSELSIGASWISSLQAEYLIPQVQQRLVKLVYTLPDMASTANQTYLSQTTLYTSVTLTLPSNITMTDMEKELANSEVSDLSLLVWLAVQHRHESAFHRLQYSYSHFAGLVIDGSELKHCSLQTLSQLDIQAFVSAVVWDSVAELELNSVDRSQPLVLPPEIAPPLCRKEQSDWWTAAYKLVNTSARVGEDWSLLQRTLQRGLDEMHLVGNHTMSLSLLVHLARSFQDTEEAGSEYSKLSEARSVFYWQAVLDMIVRVKKQKKMWIPKEWLFRPEPQLPLAERDSFIRQSELSGMTYLAEVDLRHGRLEAALERFSKVDTAEASYQQAKIYTTMAAEAPSGDDRDYLEQAREALCLTLDRLRGNQHNPLHYEVTELFDSVETRLNRSTLMRDPCESELSIRPGPEIPHSTPRSVRRTLYPVLTSPASRNPLPDLSAERAHVAASPDRIDAQLRALTVKHDGEMNEIRELVRSLTDKVEDLREEVAEVKELVKKVPQAPPPDPAPAPAPAPAPSGPPIIPPAPHQMGLPYYGYPMRDYDLLAPHAYPPGYAYAMPLPPQALAPLHHGYGAINAMGVRPPQHPAAAGLVPPPPPAQHDVYEEEEDYHDHEGVDTNDWHQPPSVSHPPPAHPHHSRYQAPAMFSPRADAGIGSNVPAPGFFSNTPDSSLAGLPVMSALQAGGAVRPSLVAGTGVPGSVATRFPMSMPQGVATTPTATVSHTAISSAGKPSASVVVTSVPDPIASTTPPTVVTASTPATNLLRSMAAQGTDVKVTQTSSVKPLPKFGSDSNAVVGNENKSLSTVGGFVFSGKPPVVEDKKVAPVITQASPVKPNPFSNFTFGAPTPAPVAAVTPASAVKTPVNHFTSPVKTPGTQYIAPAKSTTTKPGSATKSPTAKPGTVPSPGGADGADDHFEPNVDFKPIVELPEQVDLVTGEENEEKLFGERAKLFRQDAGQWKERGKGELKVMRDMTTGRCRIVMRRDQVLKLCANHTITKDMELKPLKSSENAVCWFAQDFSEEEVKRENLAAKFQTGEIMAKFRQVFEDCRQQMTNAAVKPVVKTSQDKQQSLGALFKAKPGQWECSTCLVKNEDNSTKCAACETPRPGAKQPVVKTATPSAAGASTISLGAGQGQNSKGQSLVDLFKVKPGQWECDMCLVKNEDGTTKCPACETPRPGFAQPEEKPATTAPSFGFASGGGFKFGGSATGGSPFAFGSPAANPPVTASVTKATDAAKPAASTISFGSKTQEAGAASFQFGSGSSVKFGAVGQSSVLAPANSAPVDLSIKPTAVTPAPAVKAAVIGTTRPSLGSGTFTFTPTKLDTGKSPSLACKSPQSPDGGFYVNSEGDDEHITFEPIVQLPEKVELMTGEEEEDVVYKERAKLLRFVGSEWKERGVGEVKLLRHRQTGKVRVVMRREKVHKLCLNHLISESIILKSMPNGKGKAWTWQAADFSESADSPSHETFAIRFMTEDAASLFKSAVDAAKSTESKPAVESDNQPSLLAKLLSSPAEDESDSDIELVNEEMPSPDKVEVARSFKLPDTFYNYEKCADCSGCLGCMEPPFDFSKIGQAGAYAGIIAQQGLPKLDKKEPETSKASSTPASCMFGAAAGLVDFASLASGSTNDMPFTKKTDGNTEFKWAGSGRTVFTSPTRNTDAGDDDGDDSHYEPDVDFAPVVQLAEVTDLKTGEEDEEVMFKSRAILYRFDVGSWKERGRGDIKILKDPSTGRSRVLMRRDQVFKVACNHKLTADMSLQPLATSETAWCWFATDYAENEAKNEQFAAKFKNKGTAAEFKAQFDACRTMGAASPVKGTVAANIADTKVATNETVSSAASSTSASVPTSVPATAVSSVASTTPASVPASQPAAAPFSFTLPSTQNAGGLTATASTTQGPGLFGFDKSKPGPSLFTGEKTCPGPALLSSDTSSQGPGLFSIQSDSKVPNASSASSGFSFKMPESKGPQGSGFSFQNLASSPASQPAATSGVAGFSFKPPQFGAQSVFGQAAQTVGAGDATADNAAADSDGQEEYEAGEEDGSVVFSKRMTLSACGTDEDTLQVLGQGELELVFSETGKPQLYAETEEGLVLCDHCVEPHHVATLDKKKKLVMWEACDENSMPPGDTRFSAQFSSKAAAEEFITCFNDAVEMSKQVVASKKGQDVENVGAHEADYDDEDEDEEPLFTCQARLTLLTGNLIQEVGEGELCVVHDDDVPGCRILMESATGRKMVNHIVCRQHRLLSITDDTGTCAVQWSAKDFSSDEPVKQTFKITFKSESEMISFKEMFDQALKMSQEGQFDEL